jgi:hypothetical protein
MAPHRLILTMIIKAFVAANTRQAAAPGTKAFNTRLQTLAGVNGAPSPNASVFSQDGARALDLPALTDAAAAEFDAGDLVTVIVLKTGSAAEQAALEAAAAAR